MLKDSQDLLKIPNKIKCNNLNNNISKVETSWLNLLNIPIENRNKRICGYVVDGIDPTTNIIYEFLGDYWHGNPKIYEYNKFNKTTKTSFGELYINTLNKIKDLTSKGYAVKYVWEADFKKWKKQNTSPLPITTYVTGNEL